MVSFGRLEKPFVPDYKTNHAKTSYKNTAKKETNNKVQLFNTHMVFILMGIKKARM
jgi:hypothetical protein